MINSIISFSIKNKALIWLMTIGLIIGGIYSMNKVPLDAVPDITNNQVLVITTAPNLGTEDIEQFVTYQVELAVANLPDVTEIRSVSRFGLSVVTIVFKESAGTYLPRQLVSEALAEVKEKIPEGFGEPFMAPISSGLGEIYQYTLEVQEGFDTVYDDMELRTMQEWIVKRQMAMLPGVVEVNSFGGRSKQYEVAVNPDKLRSMGLTITDIFDALEANNQNTGGAYIEKNFQANFIRGEGLMRSIDDIKNTLVANTDGQPIFVRDIAEVKYGSFVRFGAFTKNGKGEAVGGIVMMLKGENSNDVIKAVKERIALIQKSLPEGVIIKPFLDRSKLIKSTTSTVAENLSLGALIVIFVLVIFLGNLRGGLIVASTIPLALLFAFIMMNLFGVWANLMSLGALDFGILVDGAVIIVESMIFYLHRKNLIGTKLDEPKRNEIAYNSASKMMNSAFFGQLIILIVFIPVLALQGVEGKMFIPMAMTFGFAVLGVVVLCLTYIPMMAASFLQPPKTDKKSWGDKFIGKLEKIYSPVIDWALNKSRIVIAIALVLLISGGFLFTRMGAEFIPKLDEGDFAFQAFLKPGTSLTEVTKTSTRLEQIVLENFPDEIESIQSRIGVADLPMDPMPIDIADIFVILTPQDQWTRAESKKELIDKVREKVSVLPGINYEFSQPVEMRFNELLTGIRQDLAIKLYGDDLDILADKAEEIAGLVAGIDGVAAVKAEATRGLPQITVNYDRNKMGRYGLNITELNTVIETAFSGGVAGSIYEGEKMFDLVVRLDEEHRTSIDDIRNLYVILQDGNQIPIKEVAEISYQPGPMQISRDNTNRRTYVGINVEDRDIKSLVEEIQTTLDEKLELPTGYYIRYGGAFENLERATKRLTLVVPLALALIFMLVFFAVKSFKQTLMIYVAVPFAAVGGIFSLFLRDMPLSISAGVGFIVLFGVAVLNGLVLISGFNELKAEGKLHINDIIKKGSIRRIRPILLTASTDILGFLPMAISASAGAEVQRPLATVVIGGMLTSTLLTLIVLPILYKYVESGKKTIKLPKVGTAVLAVLMIVTFSVLPNELSAQDSSINLQQAIERAKENYPSIKAAQLEVDKQKALKATAYDFGSTSVYTGKEEVGNGMPGVQNQLGIAQSDIDVFGIYSKSKLANARTQQAESGQKLTEYSLARDVSMAWYNAVYAKQQFQLFKQLDSLYANFQKAAELRYKTQATSKIEYLSASAKYKELQVNIKKAESNYYASLQILNQYLLYPNVFDVNILNLEKHVFDIISARDSLNGSPMLNYYSTGIDVAESAWKAERSNFLPKLNLEYKLQSVDGNSGFYGWEAGISVPLLFFSQSGKTKATKINMQIVGQQYEQKKLEIKAGYNQQISRYLTLQEVLDYYQKEALPLAEEQIQASNLAYRLGSIDYIQFIQNMEMAIKTKQDFFKQQVEYFELSAQLKFITGK
ncbi:CusA/CzcA family heavy metal efflux RND transporter [Labilibaculum sp. A4]|uniref:CusA/CzcA family heavy metal efflux RND transporter n=1 Tax=Labilibaculum euxinus TaxID=2686357 RepID=UPI000F6171EF|nr:CusA/CzcA family heavy metal efflux RND transporter [Labilibaculum euxinus]MDQ1769350.1 CusA/CzcA family heavy metal efflux RND transporter [Labilibaculum euxinus]MWN74876.1 CusA/CzcA family heavy metal efflux RND transporter [Labilibaculum euxinus]